MSVILPLGGYRPHPKPLPARGKNTNRGKVPRPVLNAIRERANGRCERCLIRPDVLTHHRVRRSQGGRHTVSNCVRLCIPCHTDVHRIGARAYETGWLVSRDEDPSTVELLPLRGEW